MSQTNGSNFGQQVGDLINSTDQRTIAPAGVGTNLVLWSSVSVSFQNMSFIVLIYFFLACHSHRF